MFASRRIWGTIFLLGIGSLWAGERTDTFDDMEAWEVIAGDWRVEQGELYGGDRTTRPSG